MLLFLVILGCYLFTLDVPFYLDDYSSIRGNLAIRDLGDPSAIAGFAPQRLLVFFSFALNYAWHEYELSGYHVVNILIHLLASLTVLCLLRQVMQIGRIRDQVSPIERCWLPLLAALLFATHPLQVQAVTYIVQRMAAMAAMFYLASLLCYVSARLSRVRSHRWALFSLAALLAVAALLTKQNTVTLPIAILLVEVAMFGFPARNLLKLIGAVASLLLLALACFWFFGHGDLFQNLAAATKETESVSRTDYLATQMGVIWTYITKFFLPSGLRLIYDVNLTSFASPVVWAYVTGHLVVIAGALVLLRRLPLVSFGVLFYYLAHLVESGLIPIRDFAFEHRTYLPNLGLCIASGSLFLHFGQRFMGRSNLAGAAALVILALSVLTLQRNHTWRDPEVFFAHEIAKNPGSLRPWGLLGTYYLQTGDVDSAAETYVRGLRTVEAKTSGNTEVEFSYYRNAVLALDQAGRSQEAIQFLNQIPWSSLTAAKRASLLVVRGSILARKNYIAEAGQDFRNAMAFDPTNMDARLSYGKALFARGQLPKARQVLEQFLQIDTMHPSRRQALRILAQIDQMEN